MAEPSGFRQVVRSVASFEINGGKKLSGSLEISGSKNAALPCLAAALLFKRVRFSNVPKIGDIVVMTKIMESIGSKIAWSGNSVEIKNESFNLKDIDQLLIKQIRASIILTAPLLRFFDEFSLSQPGGCHIGARPLDANFSVLKNFGVDVVEQNGNLHFEYKKLSSSNRLIQCVFSVTATEIAFILAAFSKNPTIIRTAAVEPHILSLIDFLRKGGADINLIESHVFRVSGPLKTNTAIDHAIPPDYIEAGTFLIIAALLGKRNLEIKNVPVEHLDMVIEKLKEMGASIKISARGGSVASGKNEKVKIKNENAKIANVRMENFLGLKAAKIQTLPYPGFPTDVQNVFGVLATQAKGTSLIFDIMYEGRLKYLDELARMGANATILDPYRALITGPTPLYGKEITSFDIRSGASLVVAALIAQGKTVINGIESIDRGYERLEEKLRNVGADIVRK